MADAKKIVGEGHEIGNHTYSHTRMVLKSPSFIKAEIEKTDELIRQAGNPNTIGRLLRGISSLKLFQK